MVVSAKFLTLWLCSIYVNFMYWCGFQASYRVKLDSSRRLEVDISNLIHFLFMKKDINTMCKEQISRPLCKCLNKIPRDQVIPILHFENFFFSYPLLPLEGFCTFKLFDGQHFKIIDMIMQRGLAKIQFKHNQFLVK